MCTNYISRIHWCKSMEDLLLLFVLVHFGMCAVSDLCFLHLHIPYTFPTFANLNVIRKPRFPIFYEELNSINEFVWAVSNLFNPCSIVIGHPILCDVYTIIVLLELNVSIIIMWIRSRRTNVVNWPISIVYIVLIITYNFSLVTK